MAITKALDLELSSSQYASIAVSVSDDLDTTGSFTARIWLKSDAKPTTTQYLYAKWGATNADRSYMARLLPSGGDTYLQVFFNDGSGNVNNSFIVDSYVTWGNWVCWEIEWTAGGNIRTYIDNTLRDTTDGSANSAIGSNGSDFFLGKYYNTTGYIDGIVSSVYIAATDTRPVAYNLNIGPSPRDRYASILTDWDLDDNANDAAGSNNLTLSGSPSYVADVPTLTDESIDYPLTAAVGAFTLTGVASNLNIGRKITATLGTFTLTGIDAAFKTGKAIIASLGTFALTGQDAAITSVRTMAAAVGSFTLTGIDTTFAYGRKMVASVGSFLTNFKTTIITIWQKETKISNTSWTDETKISDTSWTDETKVSDTNWNNEQ